MNSRNPFKLQLAIQGGGAKLFALIAALEAVQKLEKEGRLKVTRIAGTSAGAIAGALYAARVDMDKVKGRLQQLGSVINKYVPIPNRWKMGLYLVRGSALWKEDWLQRELEEMFRCSSVTVSFRLACVMGTQHGLREAGAAFESQRDRRLSTREAEC